MRLTTLMTLVVALAPALACSGGDKSADGGGTPTDTGVDSGPPPLISHPNPIISRAKADVPAQAGFANNGLYHDGGWSTRVSALPASVAINLGAGPTRLLVQWDDGGTYNYKDPTTSIVYGLPMAYTIDVSGDTTNGTDGTWSTQVTVTDNAVRSRGHAIDFTGKSWVRMSISAAPPNISTNGVQIGEIDVHDISATSGLPDDTWFFMGDSITAFAYDRATAHQPSFAAGINTALPGYFPAMINGGIGSETSAMGLARLPEALALNPDYRFFVLGYGTNDANHGTVDSFRTNMKAMIDMVKAAGKIPIIPRIPYSGNSGYLKVPDYNVVVDELVASNQLIVGPDLFAHFMAHPEEFTCPPCGSGSARATDNLHPNDVGLAAMNQLWTESMRGLYP